jgi:hypothetical protein
VSTHVIENYVVQIIGVIHDICIDKQQTCIFCHMYLYYIIVYMYMEEISSHQSLILHNS